MSKTMTIVLSVVLVILVAACIGLAVWSSSLGGQIGTLDDDMQAFVADTATQFTITNDSIAGVDSDLTTFKTETASEFSDVQSDITGLDTSLNTFKTTTNNQFTSIQSDITGINADVTGLDTSLNSLTSQFTESTLNVRQVYDDVVGSVCQIIGDRGTGSGFIYSESGYIITCWHVINNQNYIDVVLHDGTCKRATIIGSDQDSDVAVIQISGVSNLKPLPLADSGTLVPGEPIIGVGNPRGTFETVVYGIISRTKGLEFVTNIGWVPNLIQYDAATNPGNSGGPIFNGEGQVIGITQSGYTSYYQCINFAVSSNKIQRVADAFINQGSYTSAILPGTWSMDDLTPDVAIARGLDSTFGVIVNFASGVHNVVTNDIIIAIDGVSVTDGADLFSYIAQFKSVGDTVTLTLLRGSGTSITEIEDTLTLVPGWLS
jgi:S1-C subfamily serine protease